MDSKIRQKLRYLRWRTRDAAKQAAIGWRYAIGRSKPEDGYDLLHAAESLTGIYGLEILSTYSLADDLAERYGEKHREALTELAERACSRVASKWDSSGEVRSAAEDWAGDLVEQYAKEAGLELTDAWDVAAARGAALDIDCIEPAGRG